MLRVALITTLMVGIFCLPYQLVLLTVSKQTT
jgi:hypothetical protein